MTRHTLPETKRVPCVGSGCAERRAHWCAPETPRGVQEVEVAADYEGPAYCSFECALFAGAMSVTNPGPPLIPRHSELFWKGLERTLTPEESAELEALRRQHYDTA